MWFSLVLCLTIGSDFCSGGDGSSSDNAHGGGDSYGSNGW